MKIHYCNKKHNQTICGKFVEYSKIVGVVKMIVTCKTCIKIRKNKRR